MQPIGCTPWCSTDAVLKVEESKIMGERPQVHYLSNEPQNEFIAKCSGLVKQHVLGERISVI